MEITAHNTFRVIVCGAMESMCEAAGICLMSVIGRLGGTGGPWVLGEREIWDPEDKIDVSEAKEKVVVLRKDVSSISAGAIWEETISSRRAMECSRKSCFVAMSRSGI
jgi:hypothetical protein